MDGNRITKVHTTTAGTDTTTDTYNGDNELTQQVDSVSGTTTFTYDANGSQLTSTHGGVTTTNTYDLRNRLSSVTTGGVTTTYGYDNAGNRVSETTGGTTTYYLIDAHNPTGYAKPIEVKVGSPTAAPSTTYILGLNVIGQANGSGAVSYLLVDGQDNTRALVNSSGVVTATFNFDAFGNVLGVTYTPASPPPTIFLYQQMMYDPASGLNFTESRQTPLGAPYWIERDPDGYGNNANPITLNATLFDNANPLMFTDPTGHDGLADILVTTGITGLLIGALLPADSASQRAEHALVGLVVGVQIGLLALEAAPLIASSAQFYYGFALAGAGAGVPVDITVAENEIQDLQNEEPALYSEGASLSGESSALQGKMQQLRTLISNEPGYDCSEAAESLYNANGQTGAIIRIDPKVANGINEINIGGSNPPYIYHEAYTDRQFVYDPFMSPNPIPEKDYLAQLAQLNPDAVVTFKTP